LSFLGSSKELVLVYRNMGQQSLSAPVNLLLTPQFYTLKKETLPLKYAFQAKKIAASLFDGLLDPAQKYEYMVYKEEDSWVFIAYDLQVISTFLQSKGIQAEQVAKIFFAQQSLSSFTAPVLLGEKDALLAIDDSVVLVPKSVLGEALQTLKIDESFTPKAGIALEGSFHSFISQKQAIGLATLFTLFALAFFIEGWRYGSESDEIKKEIAALLEAYPSLQSQYTRKSVAQKYKTIDRKERRKREMIKTLSGMIFKGVKVDSFKMNEKGFQIRFNCSDAKVAKRLRELSKKVGFNSVKTLTGNVVAIEEKL